MQGVGDVHAALIDKAIGVVDVLDQFVRKSMTAQAYEVDAGILDGFSSGDDVGRDVFAETTSALYHDKTADMAELMHQHIGADNGVVIDNDFPAHLGGISDNASVSDDHVMCYVNAFHQQIVVADDSSTFRRCAAIDRDVLTDPVIVPDFGRRLFPMKF